MLHMPTGGSYCGAPAAAAPKKPTKTTGTHWALQLIYKRKIRKETPTRTPTRQMNQCTARTKHLAGVACKGADPHQAHHNPRFTMLNGGLAPEHKGQREDQKVRINVRRLTRGAKHTHKTQRGRGRRPSQVLDGREGEEETRVTPTTKGSGRREAERERERR